MFIIFSSAVSSVDLNAMIVSIWKGKTTSFGGYQSDFKKLPFEGLLQKNSLKENGGNVKEKPKVAQQIS